MWMCVAERSGSWLAATAEQIAQLFSIFLLLHEIIQMRDDTEWVHLRAHLHTYDLRQTTNGREIIVNSSYMK